MNCRIVSQSIATIEKYSKIILRDELKSYGLNLAEGMVLISFFENDRENITQDKLIEELHFDKGVMTRTMQSLEQQGYVMRNENPKDKRSFLFYLTVKGKEYGKTLISIVTKWQGFLIKNLDKKTLEALQMALETIAQNAIDGATKKE